MPSRYALALGGRTEIEESRRGLAQPEGQKAWLRRPWRGPCAADRGYASQNPRLTYALRCGLILVSEVQTAVLARERGARLRLRSVATLTLDRLKSKNKTGTRVECSDA
jgi:hypothetical protein